MNSISTPLTLLLGVACLCELFVSAGRSQEERGDVRFFKYNVLSVDQEMVLEAFDLGQVRAGEKLKIQLYIRNFTKSDLRIWQTRDAITQIQLEPGTVTVAPGEGALVQATLDVPTNPRVLDKAFDMEAQLSDSCRLRGSFTSKIVDVMAFVSDEMTFEFGELDAEGRTLTVTIPLLLSDLSDARRLLAKCDEQSSFVSLSLVNNENTLSLLATFDPRNIKGDSHVVQIDLKRSGTSKWNKLTLTLRRKPDFELFPSRITFKRDADGKSFIAEVILKSRIVDVKIDALDVRCGPNAPEKVDIQLRRVNDQLGRLYLRLEDLDRSSKSSKFSLPLEVNGGRLDREYVIPAWIAN